jgi:hypothetical protein
MLVAKGTMLVLSWRSSNIDYGSEIGIRLMNGKKKLHVFIKNKTQKTELF